MLSIVSMFRSLVLAFLAPALGYATDRWGLAEAFAIGGAMAGVSAIGLGIPFLLRARRPGSETAVGVESTAAG